MKKRNFTILFLLLFSILLSLCPTPVAAADVPLLGRNRLAALPNGTDLVWLYDTLTQAIDNGEKSITIDEKEHPLTVQDFETAYAAYTGDHGEQYWFLQAERYMINKNTNNLMNLDLLYDETASQKNTFVQKLSNLYASAGITASMKDYEKAIRLHDALLGAVIYADGQNAHSAYGAIVNGFAVCDGYAKSYQILLKKAGIESYTVTGTVVHANGKTEDHAWTLAKLDGTYCHIDTTWDDVDEDSTAPYYAYFGLTDTQIAENHFIDRPAYGLPSATSTALNYFYRNGGIVPSTGDLNEVIKQLKTSSFARVYVSDNNPMQLCKWFEENVREIAERANFDFTQKLSYGYSVVGREIHLIINGARKAPETTPPETQAPETKAPETKAPETKSPETKAPETKTPETKVPETKAPESKSPETKVPETKVTETTALETKVPETKAPETKTGETSPISSDLPDTPPVETEIEDTKPPQSETSKETNPSADTASESGPVSESQQESQQPSETKAPAGTEDGRFPVGAVIGIAAGVIAVGVIVLVIVKKKAK